MKIRTSLWISVPQIAAFLVVLLALALAGCAPPPTPTPTPLPTPTLPPTAALPDEVSIPINAEDANNIGALHLELIYDPAVLEPTEVEKGMLARNAMLESSTDTPGRVVIGMIDAAGINGNGSLAVISFRVVGKDGMTSPLILEKLTAHDATTLVDVPTKATSGSFTVKDRSFTTPIILFSP